MTEAQEALQTAITGTQPRIAVIGDVMLDEHISVDVIGLSPEDDLAYKLRPTSSALYAGGAANVALNVRSMGADVLLCGLIGEDNAGVQLLQLLDMDRLSTNLAVANRPTTHKTRFATRRRRQVMRLDREVLDVIPEALVEPLLTSIKKFKPDLTIVQDYNKGVITRNVIGGLNSLGLPYVVGLKKMNPNWYGPARLIAMNEMECHAAFGRTDIPATLYNHQLHTGQAVLVTLSDRGAYLFAEKNGLGSLLVTQGVRSREFGDPSGCGDTVLAVMTWAMACKTPLTLACAWAIAAGACTFDHEGAHVITPAEIQRELGTFNYW